MSDDQSDSQSEKPGPKPDHLKLDGDWEDRMKEVLEKERPKEGWPEPEDKETEGDSDE